MNAERGRMWRLAALWAFPIALWLVGTGWYGFDLGKYSDDWANCYRDLSTGAFRWPTGLFERWPFFWRPLHVWTMCSLSTVLWEHDWIIHAISAATHFAAFVLLRKLLTRTGCSALGATMCAAWFLVCPLHAEAVLWSAGIGLPAAACCLLLTLAWCRERVQDAGRWSARRSAAACFGALAGAFVTACWYEPGAAVLGALPLFLIASAGREIPRGITARRVVLLTISAGAGCAIYVALLIGTVQPGRRGAADTLVDSGSAVGRIGLFVRQIEQWIVGDRGLGVLAGSVVHGAAGMATLWGALAVAGLLLLGWWSVFGGSRPDVQVADSPRKPWCLLAFGLLAALMSLVPIAATRGNYVFSRYFYFVDLGIAIAMAAAWSIARERLQSRGVRIGLKAVAVVMLVVGVVGMVGWQRAFRERDRLDRADARSLRELIPNPVAGTVFVPIAPHDRVARTGYAGFDYVLPSAFARAWSSTPIVARTYGRADVICAFWNSGARGRYAASPDAVVLPRSMCDAHGVPLARTELVDKQSAMCVRLDDERPRILEWEEFRQILRNRGLSK